MDSEILTRNKKHERQKKGCLSIVIRNKKRVLITLTMAKLTEDFVYEIVASGSLVAGVKFVIKLYKDNTTNFRREVLLLALLFCLSLLICIYPPRLGPLVCRARVVSTFNISMRQIEVINSQRMFS